MTDWWKPSEIRYTREQCIFIIVELVIGKIDTWPTNPAGSGYTDAQWSKKSKRRPGAYFTNACQVRAEVWIRLGKCERDGYMVIAHYCGLDNELIAKLTQLDIGQVERGINNALSYISSGPDMRWHDTEKRKGVSYKDWRGHRRTNK